MLTGRAMVFAGNEMNISVDVPVIHDNLDGRQNGLVP
jgi:hypothetical protein